MNKITEYDLFDGVHKGETCTIIGNGPSLLDVPFGFLNKYPTFGTNRIYLLDGFEPCYYVAVNPLVIAQFIHEITEKMAGSVKFIAERFAASVPNAVPVRSIGPESFCFDPRSGLYEGWTVTYVCLQLAYFMGFKTVYLVGVDHRYNTGDIPGGVKLDGSGSDANHFDAGYFGTGTSWHSPDLTRSARAYELARKVFKADERRIVNLTAGSALEVFEKQTLEDIYHE